jgi:hypothetical protein
MRKNEPSPIFAVCLCLTLSVLIVSGPVVHATIIGSVSGPDLITGKFTYSYTIDNSAEPVFEVTSWFLDVSAITPEWTVFDITIPADWSALPPTGTQDFFTFSSLFGGAAVPAGGVLSGFSFPSTLPPGSVSFGETLFDPITFSLDSATGFSHWLNHGTDRDTRAGDMAVVQRRLGRALNVLRTQKI